MYATDFPDFEGLPYIVQKALIFAEQKHKGQLRKDGSTPYITHPMGCLTIALGSPWHFTDCELAALCLHDVFEDTKTTFEELYAEFYEDVAGIVFLLSKPVDAHFRRRIYMAALKRVAPSVIALKLVDMLHNLGDLPPVAMIYENKLNPAQGLLKEDPDFAEYFRKKVEEDAFPLIDVLRMHGEIWHFYANWIETQIRKELGK